MTTNMEKDHLSVLTVSISFVAERRYSDVIMGVIASQITSLTIVYSTVYSDADQRKHQSSASLAFVRGIHRWPMNSPHKWPVTWKMLPFDDVIMMFKLSYLYHLKVTHHCSYLHQRRRLWFYLSWWRHEMETFSALLAIYAGNSPVPSEFPAQRPVTRSLHVFFDLCRNKRLSKQSQGWWFETPSRPLWRHRNVLGSSMGVLWYSPETNLVGSAPGPRLNIKTVLSTYGDFHFKDKTAVRTSYL